jgi:hypothetical protein
MVEQSVPHGYSYKIVKLRCGSTSIYGSTLLCEACERQMHKQYPQGWRETPGDLCPHGNYVGDAGGPDYLCGRCEAGD